MSDNFRAGHNSAVKAMQAPLATEIAGVLPD